MEGAQQFKEGHKQFKEGHNTVRTVTCESFAHMIMAHVGGGGRLMEMGTEGPPPPPPLTPMCLSLAKGLIQVLHPDD